MDKLHTVSYDYSQICFFACVWISAGDGYKSSTRRLLTIYVAATLTPKPHSFNDWSRTQRPKKNHWYFLLYLATYSNSCQVSGLVKLHHRHDFFGVDYLHKYPNFKLQPGHGFRAFLMLELRYVSKLYCEISVFVLLSTGLPTRGWH